MVFIGGNGTFVRGAGVGGGEERMVFIGGSGAGLAGALYVGV